MTAPLSDERIAEIRRDFSGGVMGAATVFELLAEVERLRTELDELRGQNAMTESHFSNYVAEAIVTQDQLRQRAEAAEAELESLLDGTDVTPA